MTVALAVPPQWRVMTLAELGATCTSGSRGWASRYVKRGDLFVRITNLRRSSIHPDLSDSRHVAVDPNEPEARRTRLAVGDLLISITADIGIIGYVDKTIPTPAYINQHIARVRLDPKRVDSRFVAYYLASWGPQRGFVGSTDTGAKAGMNLATVSRLETLVPSLPEQRAIAAALGDADDQIEKVQRLIAKKQAIKQGMMQQLLTGRTRLPGFTSVWTTRLIGDFAQVKAGGTPSTSVPRYWGGDVRWMSSGEIHKKRVCEVEGRITRSGLRESAAQLLPVGTVLMALAGQGKTRGTVAVSRVELSTNQSIAGILPSAEHDSDFLYYNLDTRYEELRGESSGEGGRGGLNLTIIKRLPVLIPPRAEQAAIAQVLSDVDDEIEGLEHRLAKARSIKHGMMQELLTGRTRLPLKEATA